MVRYSTLIPVVCLSLVLAGCIDEGDDDDDKQDQTVHAFKAFIFTNNHTAASNGTSDHLLYLENQGNVEDTYELEISEATAGLEMEPELSNVTLAPGNSTAIILHSVTTEAANGSAGALLGIVSSGSASVKSELSIELWVEEDLGDNMSSNDSVGVYYLGTHVNGVLFDTNFESVAKNQSMPRDSGMGQHYSIFDLKPSIEEANVILGFKEPLTPMRLNETVVVRIPPEKAYGSTGTHKLAGETLIFEIFLAEKY